MGRLHRPAKPEPGNRDCRVPVGQTELERPGVELILPGLLSLFDFSQLAHGNSIVVAVHGFFGTNETVDIQYSTMSKRQLDFQTLLQNGVKIANAKYFTKAVHAAQIGFQVEVL